MTTETIRVLRLSRALTPIPWGKRDRVLAQAVCQNVVDTTPPIEVPYNFRTSGKVRRVLDALKVCHE